MGKPLALRCCGNFLSNQTPAARLGAVLGQPVGRGRPSAPLKLKATGSLEEVCTIGYTVVDAAFKKLFVRPAYFRTRPNAEPVFTEAEVMRLALVPELSGDESPHAWWDDVHKNYRHLFRWGLK